MDARAAHPHGLARAVPYDPEREHAHASYRAKQLVVLAADVVLERIAVEQRDAAAVADELIRDRVLPSCYRRCYDEDFLRAFARVTELARNLLVSDMPFLPDTVSELAAHAILAQAKVILDAAGQGWEAPAALLDAALPEQLARNDAHLARELDILRDAAFEDTDARLLFDLPDDEDPVASLYARLRPDERELLRFENWRVPFGSAPRPHITYDARAWPIAL